MTNFGIIEIDELLADFIRRTTIGREKKKKCNINFIRLKRGGTVVSARISAKESTGRRNRPRRYPGQEDTKTKGTTGVLRNQRVYLIN